MNRLSFFSSVNTEVNSEARRVVEKHVADLQREMPAGTPKAERELQTMMMMLDMFNPQVHDERLNLINTMPSNYQATKDALMEAMMQPQKSIKSASFFKSVTREVASESIRLAMMDYIKEHSKSIEAWNKHYQQKPEDPMFMSESDMELFQQRANLMYEVCKQRQESVRKQSISYMGQKMSGRAGLSSLGVSSSVLTGLVVAGTVAGSVATAGIVAGAVLTVAVVAFLYFRHKRAKRFKELDKTLTLARQTPAEYTSERGVEIDEGLKKLVTDPNQMEQSVRNLALNKVNESDVTVDNVLEKLSPLVDAVHGPAAVAANVLKMT